MPSIPALFILWRCEKWVPEYNSCGEGVAFNEQSHKKRTNLLTNTGLETLSSSPDLGIKPVGYLWTSHFLLGLGKKAGANHFQNLALKTTFATSKNDSKVHLHARLCARTHKIGWIAYFWKIVVRLSLLYWMPIFLFIKIRDLCKWAVTELPWFLRQSRCCM